MNKDFLYYYNMELEHLRQMCGEFARNNPKIANRLGLNEFGSNDPYVERLIQGVSFLTGNVHQKLDSEYPKLSRGILSSLFPDFLLPVPAAGIVKFSPNFSNITSNGIIIPKNELLLSEPGANTGICQFTTGHKTMIWPLNITDAKYYTDEISYLKTGHSDSIKSCLKLDLEILGNNEFKDLKMEDMELYISNPDNLKALKIYELIIAHCKQILIRSNNKKFYSEQIVLSNFKNERIIPRGFDIKDALYNFNDRMFEGYRLIQKYLFFYKSFMFLKINNIRAALNNIRTEGAEIIFLFDKEEPVLKESIQKENLSMYCTPIINLFEKKIRQAKYKNIRSEYQISDNFRTSENYEIIKVMSVSGKTTGTGKEKKYIPLYANRNYAKNEFDNDSFFTVKRIPVWDEKDDSQSGYYNRDSKVIINLVDKNESPIKPNLEELDITILCSNKNFSKIQSDKTISDFIIDTGSAISKINFIYGPTEPYSEHLFLSLWKVINHISLNWLSIQDADGTKTAEVLKSILNIYSISGNLSKTINSLKAVKISKKTHRLKEDGNFTFTDGIAVDVLFDDISGENTQFILGAVFDNFFMYAVPINSIVQTSIRTCKKGIIMKWPVRKGQFPLI